MTRDEQTLAEAELSGRLMAIELVLAATLRRLKPAAAILDEAMHGIAVAEGKMRAELPESEAAYTLAMSEAARNTVDNIRLESGIDKRA